MCSQWVLDLWCKIIYLLLCFISYVFSKNVVPCKTRFLWVSARNQEVPFFFFFLPLCCWWKKRPPWFLISLLVHAASGTRAHTAAYKLLKVKVHTAEANLKHSVWLMQTWLDETLCVSVRTILFIYFYHCCVAFRCFAIWTMRDFTSMSLKVCVSFCMDGLYLWGTVAANKQHTVSNTRTHSAGCLFDWFQVCETSLTPL